MSDTKLVLRPPSKSDRGFLRRQKAALMLDGRRKRIEYETLKLQRERAAGGNAEELAARESALSAETIAIVDDSIAMILPYVVEPVDRDAAIAALEDASQDEIENLQSLIAGATPLAATDGASASASSASG